MITTIFKPSMSSAHFLILLLHVILTGAAFAAPIVLPLTHRLSDHKFTTPNHLLKSTTTRSAARRPVSLPLSPGSDYTLTFSIGAAPNHQSISMYMDTGSDVVWFPCTPFECILCEGKELPPSLASTKFNLNHTTTTAAAVHCTSSSCSAAHSSLPTSDLCAMSNCPLESIELDSCPKTSSCPPFYYAYGDGSFVAKLYHDTLSIPSLKVQNFTFGCAHTTLAEPIGVAGFGRGSLSLPAQLARVSPQLGNQFSYCLISHNYMSDKLRRPSPLILGRREHGGQSPADLGDKKVKGVDQLVYTPMLNNPKHPYFYCVGLTGISVGKMNIPAPASFQRVDSKGNGGLVVDSGTTFTMLPAKFYNSIVAEFDKRVSRVGKRASQTESTLGLSHCYYFDDDVARTGVVPSLTLHFGGAKNGNETSSSSVTLPRRNYFYEFMDGGDGGKKRKVGCLMVINGGDDEEGGPSGILGNYFQQGFEVVYDLEKERVGFVRRKCDSLWDEIK